MDKNGNLEGKMKKEKVKRKGMGTGTVFAIVRLKLLFTVAYYIFHRV